MASKDKDLDNLATTKKTVSASDKKKKSVSEKIDKPSNTKTTSKAKAATETKVKASPKAKAATETKVKASPKTKATTETKVKASPKAKATTETKVKASPKAKATTETKVKVASIKSTPVKKSTFEAVQDKIDEVEQTEESIIDVIDKVFDLPNSYNETKLSLIMRDPDWCYFYWDISDIDIDNHEIHSRELKVKIFQMSGVDITLHQEHTEVTVGHTYGDYSINLHTPHAYFMAELGYYNNDGIFTVLTRSNVIYAPRDSISNIYDDKWVVNEDIVKLLSEPGSLKMSLSSATIFELVDLSQNSLSSISLFKKRDS